MSGRRNDGGREAVSWLATGVVCFLGILFCGFIVLMFARNPQTSILTMSSIFVGFAVLMWLLREKPPDVIGEEESKWFGFFRKAKPTRSLKLHRRRQPKIVEFGTNEPPSAEKIREIKELTDGMKNWVPPATDPHHKESPSRPAASDGQAHKLSGDSA